MVGDPGIEPGCTKAVGLQPTSAPCLLSPVVAPPGLEPGTSGFPYLLSNGPRVFQLRQRAKTINLLTYYFYFPLFEYANRMAVSTYNFALSHFVHDLFLRITPAKRIGY